MSRVSVMSARVRAGAIGLAAATLVVCWMMGVAGASKASVPSSTLSSSTCKLAAPYKHVVYIQFDNQHLSRDNRNVPSDIEQVPALKNFLSGNGALLSDEHTPLISHTANDIVTSLTGLYPDRQGLAVANSYAQYAPNSGTVQKFPSAFTYWTDPVSSTDPLPNLITDGQNNTPAPWVSYTRAGCDVGAFSIADMELENTSSDITSVFGNGTSQQSPQQAFTSASGSGAPSSALKAADFEGIAIHCSQADSADNGSGNHTALCSPQNGGVADKLPDEPGGYSGFNGLFGAIYANQVTSKPGSFTPSTQDNPGKNNGNINDLAAPVNDVYAYSSPGCKYCANGVNKGYNGQLLAPHEITDNSGNSGFVSGFDPTPAQTLGYVASMQESGVPVTFAYIEDAHNQWTYPYSALGPGDATYVDQLRQENQAFEAFFERLAGDGINKSNTLFVITADEGDHYAGLGPNNPGCNGTTTPCTYSAGTIGEQDVYIDDALAKEADNTNPFAIHFDDNPNFYVDGPSGSTAPPGPYDTAVRQLEQKVGTLTLTDLLTNKTVPVTRHIADAEDQTILHMTTTDPLRTPSFTLFGNPAFFYQTLNPEALGPAGATCPPGTTPTPGCPEVSGAYAWNHGGDEPEVTTTWLGVAGPTVSRLGETGSIWTEHTDIRPTMLALLGLSSDYQMDGAVIGQLLGNRDDSIRHLRGYERLAAAYDQLNAPVGQFGHDSEVVSTTAAESSSPNDVVAKGFDQQLTTCQVQRDALATRMKAVLNGAFFGGSTVGQRLVSRYARQADQLVDDMHWLSEMSRPPSREVCGTRRD